MGRFCFVMFLLTFCTVGSCSLLKFGMCKYPSAGSDFNVEKFFNKKWYVWKSMGSLLFNNVGTCAGTDTSIQGPYANLLHFQYEPMLKRYVSIRGYVELEYLKLQGLLFPVNFQFFDKWNYTLPLAIVGTDYQSWAAVYYCRQLLGLKIEMSWLMCHDRNQPSGTAKDQIAEAVRSVNLSLDDYTYQNNANCDEGEPHL